MALSPSARRVCGSLSDDVSGLAILAPERELRRLLKSADDGVHVAPGKTTLATWFTSWTALLERTVSTKTLERYSELVRLHVLPTLGSRPLQSIKATEVDQFYRRLGDTLAPRTVHHVHTVFNACFKAAIRQRLATYNPVSMAEAPRLATATRRPRSTQTSSRHW